MVALAILKAYWRELALLAAVTLFAWCLWSAITSYGQDQYDAGYSKRESEYEDARKQNERDHIKDMERRERETNEQITNLEAQLAAVRNRPPGKPVWMCNDPASVPATAGSASANGTPGADEEAHAQPPGAVRDIGPGTRELLDEGDSAIIELTELQAWVTRECLRPASQP